MTLQDWIAIGSFITVSFIAIKMVQRQSYRSGLSTGWDKGWQAREKEARMNSYLSNLNN